MDTELRTAIAQFKAENGRNKEVINIHAEWENGTRVAWASSRKCALTLHTCISATDRVNINEQNKSIAIGPLYLQTEFEAI